MRDPRYYCVYIMGSLTGTLYIGISSNLHKRVFQHKFHHHEGFTDRYDVVRLVYWEILRRRSQSPGPRKAIKRMDTREKNRFAGTPQSTMERPGLRVVPLDAAE
jgi:putative endonuclease